MMGIKKVLVIVIPLIAIITAMMLVFWISDQYPPYPPVPEGPVTEYSSLKELEEWVGKPLPKPSYLPKGYEIVRIYKIGSELAQGQIPDHLYMLYSDEEVNIEKVTSWEGLLNALGTMGKPGGYKLLLLWQRHDQKITVEYIENLTQNYVKRLKEKGSDADLIQVNDIPAVLQREKDRFRIIWFTPEYSFWLSGAHPEIALDELVKIAKSVRSE